MHIVKNQHLQINTQLCQTAAFYSIYFEPFLKKQYVKVGDSGLPFQFIFCSKYHSSFLNLITIFWHLYFVYVISVSIYYFCFLKL